ncbi:hypothetical protein A0O28_0070730 [Trichoderma guizhouense]|uniref:Uncharacterized protein n=1 Tax=Trichoderma guizhouense TaxID=1491466 RepID=A0A1T3D0Q1_9HYPO|nr:hypothetical protein A0O28_0070730 [Trichoderma guizhouense]
MADSLILGSSPIFGRIDSFIFEDWASQIDGDNKIEEPGSGKLPKIESVPDLVMAGYFPAPDNKIVVYEVAYTKRYQIIWSFLCKKTDVTDAQAKALSEVQKTPETTELKRKWGGTWEGISTKDFLAVWAECFRTFEDEEGSRIYPSQLLAMPVTKLSNGVVMKVMHIIF